MLRITLVGGFFFASLPFMIALQWVLAAMKSPLWGPASVAYYQLLRWTLRIRVQVNGQLVTGRPVLIVANHVSWVDIVVLASIAPASVIIDDAAAAGLTGCANRKTGTPARCRRRATRHTFWRRRRRHRGSRA